jgi:HEAT repeat protein
MMKTNRILTLASVLLTVALTAASAQNATPVAPGSLDTILKQASAYDGGISSDALWKLREYVYSRKDDAGGRAECETKLLAFLKGPATHPAKMAATRLLRMVAGDTAIPALQAMLADPQLSDYAVYVLQPMPGAAAEAALAQSLKTARGAQKAAVVAALGQRRASSALPLLEPMLRDPALSTAATIAIGRIGGPAASKALASAYGAASGDSKRLLAASLLEAGDTLLAAKDTEAAASLFGTLAADRTLPAPMRTAASIGSLSAAGPRAATLLLSMLEGNDADARAAAVARLGDVIPPDGIGPVCDMLPRLPEAERIQVLAAMSRYPAARVRPAALEAAKGGSDDVRVAALRTLESVGDASTVAFLADTAASGPKGAVQDAARHTLASLKGREVDDAIVTLLGQPAPAALTAELLKAVAERRLFAAKPVVSASLAAPSAVVRTEAMKTLRAIGTPSDASPVLDVLVKTSDEAEQAEAEKTVAALLQKIGSPDNRARLVRMRLATEKDPAVRARLIGLLAPTGDGAALPVLRTALGDADAGVVDAAARGIAAWPTASARDDMLKLVRESKDETHRLLAFGGLVRLVAADAYRMPEAAVADLKLLSGLAWRPEEQKLVLGAAGAFPCQAALDFANGFMTDDALKAEAKAAVDKITQGMQRPGRR